MISLRFFSHVLNWKVTPKHTGVFYSLRSPRLLFARRFCQNFCLRRQTDVLTFEGEQDHQTVEEIYKNLKPDLDKNLGFHQKYLHDLCRHGHTEVAETWLQKVVEHKRTSANPDMIQTLFQKVMYGWNVRGKADRVLALQNMMMQNNVDLNEGLYSMLIGIHCSNEHTWKSGLELYNEMVSKGIEPHAREYLPLINAASSTGDLQTAWSLLQKLYNYPLVCNEQSMSTLTAFIKLLASSCDDEWIQKITFLAQFLRNNDLLPTDEMLAALEELFQRSPGSSWTSRFSSAEFVNGSLQCSHCQTLLDKSHLTTKEDDMLHQQFVERMEDMIMETDPSPNGKKVNSILLGKMRKLLKARGPFDVVLDGLNIGYMANRGKFRVEVIKDVVDYFLKQQKRVLVIGSGPMKHSYLANPQFANTPFKMSIRKAILQFMSTPSVACFLLRQSFCDDLFIIYAAALSGPNTLLVSNDQFTDHIHTSNKNLRNNMQRWLDTHLAKCIPSDHGGFTKIEEPCSIVHNVLIGNNMFHFPSADKERWLCVQKDAEAENSTHCSKAESVDYTGL